MSDHHLSEHEALRRQAEWQAHAERARLARSARPATPTLRAARASAARLLRLLADRVEPTGVART